MNVIRKLFWFMFIYLLDYPANTMKQETFHQVKWWYIWKCSLLCQVPAMTPSGSSELDNTEMVNSLKCCKWKVSSILWSNHQHQQRPSEKWGCTRNKGMQIVFSSTPNSAQEEPNSVQIFCFSTLHYSDNREIPCIVTVPWFSWVTSFDEWWVTLIQTNQTIECLNCMVNIVIIAHSDKIVCSICFWYDLLVVMNAINKAFGSCWWTF
jgi:hypothetical protein